MVGRDSMCNYKLVKPPELCAKCNKASKGNYTFIHLNVWMETN